MQQAACLAFLLVICRCMGQGFGEDFHVDIDGIAVSAGSHHACALEYRPGLDIGGPVHCWGYDHHGQSTPPEVNFGKL